ncbi:MAG: N-acetylglucosamine kinase [Isosphaeraceae bacterium]
MTAQGTTLYLGVDGGGTSTVALIAGPEGPVLGQGRSGPSNAKAVGLPRARLAIDAAIGEAFSRAGLDRRAVETLCLGLAGFDRPEDRRILESWNEDAGWARRLILVNDGDLVLAAGTPQGWGVGLIAGTGSIAVGRAPNGRKARAGGWGPLIGDEGSAYAVVLDALRLVARRADGRDPRPPGTDHLSDQLREAFGAETPAQIVTGLYAPGMDRTHIAAIAPRVLELLDHDGDVANQILPRAGAALAELVVAVARSLGLDSGEFPLAMAGGFLLSSPALIAIVKASLIDAGLRVSVTQVPEPVQGALRLAQSAGD